MTVQAINERSRLHREVIQPKLAAAGITEGVDYLPSEITGAIGNPVALHMKRLTDDVIESVDIAVESCAALVAEFYEAMKRQFPDHKIVRLAPTSHLTRWPSRWSEPLLFEHSIELGRDAPQTIAVLLIGAPRDFSRGVRALRGEKWPTVAC